MSNQPGASSVPPPPQNLDPRHPRTPRPFQFPTLEEKRNLHLRDLSEIYEPDDELFDFSPSREPLNRSSLLKVVNDAHANISDLFDHPIDLQDIYHAPLILIAQSENLEEEKEKKVSESETPPPPYIPSIPSYQLMYSEKKVTQDEIIASPSDYVPLGLFLNVPSIFDDPKFALTKTKIPVNPPPGYSIIGMKRRTSERKRKHDPESAQITPQTGPKKKRQRSGSEIRRESSTINIPPERTIPDVEKEKFDRKRKRASKSPKTTLRTGPMQKRQRFDFQKQPSFIPDARSEETNSFTFASRPLIPLLHSVKAETSSFTIENGKIMRRPLGMLSSPPPSSSKKKSTLLTPTEKIEAKEESEEKKRAHAAIIEEIIYYQEEYKTHHHDAMTYRDIYVAKQREFLLLHENLLKQMDMLKRYQEAIIESDDDAITRLHDLSGNAKFNELYEAIVDSILFILERRRDFYKLSFDLHIIGHRLNSACGKLNDNLALVMNLRTEINQGQINAILSKFQLSVPGIRITSYVHRKYPYLKAIKKLFPSIEFNPLLYQEVGKEILQEDINANFDYERVFPFNQEQFKTQREFNDELFKFNAMKSFIDQYTFPKCANFTTLPTLQDVKDNREDQNLLDIFSQLNLEIPPSTTPPTTQTTSSLPPPSPMRSLKCFESLQDYSEILSVSVDERKRVSRAKSIEPLSLELTRAKNISPSTLVEHERRRTRSLRIASNALVHPSSNEKINHGLSMAKSNRKLRPVVSTKAQPKRVKKSGQPIIQPASSSMVIEDTQISYSTPIVPSFIDSPTRGTVQRFEWDGSKNEWAFMDFLKPPKFSFYNVMYQSEKNSDRYIDSMLFSDNDDNDDDDEGSMTTTLFVDPTATKPTIVSIPKNVSPTSTVITPFSSPSSSASFESPAFSL